MDQQYAAVTARVSGESGHKRYKLLSVYRPQGRDMGVGATLLLYTQRFVIGKCRIPENERAPRAVLIHGGLFAVPPCGFVVAFPQGMVGAQFPHR